MSDIEKKLLIAAPLDKVWAALTEPPVMGEWMDDDSIQIDLKIGGAYAVFGGDTTGRFTRIETPHRLEYTWRQSTWRKTWKDSIVMWSLKKGEDGTLLTLVHTQFPNADERNSHDEGWDTYWLGPMREWLERG